jgi:hypothetical protein
LSSKALPGWARKQCSGGLEQSQTLVACACSGTELGGSSGSASSGNSSSRCSRMRRRSSATICWRVRRVRSASPRSARRTEGTLEESASRADGRSRCFTACTGCANLASGPPLHIVVDDAHRADAPSLRYLAFLLPRLEELPVALAVATRPHVPAGGRGLLEAITGDLSAEVVRPPGCHAPACVTSSRWRSEPSRARVRQRLVRRSETGGRSCGLRCDRHD